MLYALYKKVSDADEKLLLQIMQAFVVIAIIAYLLPYLVPGSANHWMIWDNLDSNFVMYKVLLDSGALFAPNSAIIGQPLGGIPRGTMASEFDAFVWLYILFGPEGAYIANRILMTLVGFIGMYLLLRRHILTGDENEIVRLGASLCFSLLPFWPFGGLSVAGMPLALHAMLEIREKNFRWWNWAIIILYPFYSSLVLSGFFFLVFVSLIWLHDLMRRKLAMPLFFALTVMSLFYVLTHYRLFIDFVLGSGFVSHRSEMISSTDVGAKEAIKNAMSLLYAGQPHAHSLQKIVILPIVMISVLLMLPQSKNDRKKWLFWLAIMAIGAIAIFHGFKTTPPISTIMAPIKAVLPMQFDRFYFLYPLLWTLAFALVLSRLSLLAHSLRLLVLMVVTLQSAYSFTHHESFVNFGKPSVGEFFAAAQFSDIKDYIGEPPDKYRVASLGMHPSISLYNGFRTLDGYWGNYPLSYKHEFREIISGELEKDEALKNYFDEWGSRAYLFNARTRRNMTVAAGNDVNVKALDYDWEAFYALGGRFLLSAVAIDASTIPELTFERKFIDSASAWDVYLYRVGI